MTKVMMSMSSDRQGGCCPVFEKAASQKVERAISQQLLDAFKDYAPHRPADARPSQVEPQAEQNHDAGPAAKI